MNEPKRNRKAVALKYDQEHDVAPKITASGKGYVAETIIQKAEENNVAIQEDPTLVHLLSQLNVNEKIPEELYLAVAEVFAFIYHVDQEADKTKHKR
ncbi:EscU/YscU/HrcU family type III secretion system export apparatus switch protein [Aquibacillus koreensis]|uniref:EscU/YscU/HrcU family type III secretion system export apparatus switch protein n=1 Tax=Aquibacillus koreensis TaxID=279446 RepID=A0A9X4AJK5_9BACI|nr:EscU/YscU/HrcU family type III secretion system export apparatus switch protein [Aquibacillus koreensis]MCT2534507.1 EscU/YscU/HrcU family type III secretion system export apparatus switch protein [Aquibacillus koreensis]MDC3421899.1 EscU/YscU/HrcU family type III secretion system export apparatus switch protein [Aquibacillus koreensis]